MIKAPPPVCSGHPGALLLATHRSGEHNVPVLPDVEERPGLPPQIHTQPGDLQGKYYSELAEMSAIMQCLLQVAKRFFLTPNFT